MSSRKGHHMVAIENSNRIRADSNYVDLVKEGIRLCGTSVTKWVTWGDDGGAIIPYDSFDKITLDFQGEPMLSSIPIYIKKLGDGVVEQISIFTTGDISKDELAKTATLWTADVKLQIFLIPNKTIYDYRVMRIFPKVDVMYFAVRRRRFIQVAHASNEKIVGEYASIDSIHQNIGMLRFYILSSKQPRNLMALIRSRHIPKIITHYYNLSKFSGYADYLKAITYMPDTQLAYIRELSKLERLININFCEIDDEPTTSYRRPSLPESLSGSDCVYFKLPTEGPLYDLNHDNLDLSLMFVDAKKIMSHLSRVNNSEYSHKVYLHFKDWHLSRDSVIAVLYGKNIMDGYDFNMNLIMIFLLAILYKHDVPKYQRFYAIQIENALKVARCHPLLKARNSRTMPIRVALNFAFTAFYDLPLDLYGAINIGFPRSMLYYMGPFISFPMGNCYHMGCKLSDIESANTAKRYLFYMTPHSDCNHKPKVHYCKCATEIMYSGTAVYLYCMTCSDVKDVCVQELRKVLPMTQRTVDGTRYYYLNLNGEINQSVLLYENLSSTVSDIIAFLQNHYGHDLTLGPSYKITNARCGNAISKDLVFSDRYNLLTKKFVRVATMRVNNHLYECRNVNRCIKSVINKGPNTFYKARKGGRIPIPQLDAHWRGGKKALVTLQLKQNRDSMLFRRGNNNLPQTSNSSSYIFNLYLLTRYGIANDAIIEQCRTLECDFTF